jgi:predicted DNA-binding transcriptional regulator YafY
MATLALAIKSKATVAIGYADSDGGVSERVIEPIHLIAGILMAYDHRSDEVLRFSVSRISGVAIVE